MIGRGQTHIYTVRPGATEYWPVFARSRNGALDFHDLFFFARAFRFDLLDVFIG